MVKPDFAISLIHILRRSWKTTLVKDITRKLLTEFLLDFFTPARHTDESDLLYSVQRQLNARRILCHGYIVHLVTQDLRFSVTVKCSRQFSSRSYGGLIYLTIIHRSGGTEANDWDEKRTLFLTISETGSYFVSLRLLGGEYHLRVNHIHSVFFF